MTSRDLRALLDVIEQLRKQHKAGISPTFGQVDELFALADSVRLELVQFAPVREVRMADQRVEGWGEPVGGDSAAERFDRAVNRIVLDLPAGSAVLLRRKETGHGVKVTPIPIT